MKKLGLLIIFLVTGCSCTNNSQDIQEPYRSQIKALQNENFRLTKATQDLQKQIEYDNAEIRFNQERIQTYSTQALVDKGLSQDDYRINLSNMKFERMGK